MKVRQLTWDDTAAEAMQPSVDASPWAGVSGMGDALGNAHLWEFAEGTRRVLLAVRGTQRERGRLLEVIGMRSLGDRFQANELSHALETIARDAYGHIDLLSMVTRRDHLVRACQREGWTAVARVVTKPLHVH